MGICIGDRVSFRREEPINHSDGSLYRWDRWTQEGMVKGILSNGRLEVSFDDAHWGASITTLSVEEATLLEKV